MKGKEKKRKEKKRKEKKRKERKEKRKKSSTCVHKSLGSKFKMLRVLVY